MRRIVGWVVILAGFLAGLLTLPRLRGVASAELEVAFALPAVALAIWVLAIMRPVPWIERAFGPRLPGWLRGESRTPGAAKRQRHAMEIVGLAVVLGLIGLHALELARALQGPAALERTMPAVVGLALIIGGNSAPRLRRNLFAGIRTRATLADPIVWARVHRQFGRLLVGAGLATIVIALFDDRAALSAAAFGVLGSTLAVCLVERLRRMPPLPTLR